MDEEKRETYIDVLNRTWGPWAVEHSRLAALAVVEREELEDVRVGGVSLLACACRHWEGLARRVIEERPEVLDRMEDLEVGEGRKQRSIAHVIARQWEGLAHRLTATPAAAARTYGTDRAVLDAALRWETVAERVVEGPAALGRIPARGEPSALHGLVLHDAERARRVLEREELRAVGGEAGGEPAAEAAVRAHPGLALASFEIARWSLEGRDPLVHVAAREDPRVADHVAGAEGPEARALLAAGDADGVPLVHRYVGRRAVADRALAEAAVGRIPGADGRSARRAALRAHPGPINAWRVVRGAWRDGRAGEGAGEGEEPAQEPADGGGRTRRGGRGSPAAGRGRYAGIGHAPCSPLFFCVLLPSPSAVVAR